MKTLTWAVEEGFYFPQGFGFPNEMVSVKVTPQWTEEYSNDSLILHGIYHVAANIQFQPGDVAEYANANHSYIEDLDMQDDVGYFEYAIPLHVDLPLEKVKQNTNPQLEVLGVKSVFREDGTCLLKWDASCSFEEVEDEQFEVLESPSSSSSFVFSSEKSEEVVQKREESVVIEQKESAVTNGGTEPEEASEDHSTFYVYDLKDEYSVSNHKSNNITVE